MPQATKTHPAQNPHDTNAAPIRPYPFPVGVYESQIQDYDEIKALGATIAAWVTGLQMPNWKVSPTGWLRTLWLDATLTIAGNSATPTLAENGPWLLYQKVTLYDLGGEQIIQLNGYELMLANKFGGYYDINDPRLDLTFSVTAGSGASAGSVHMILAIPFEAVARDALGTVQNESTPGWKVEIYLGAPTDVYGTTPTAAGTASLRLRGFPESYTEPLSEAPNGRRFAQAPPLPGSLQYWKSEDDSVPAGTFKFDLTNGVGFPIRNIIYYALAASDSLRATADTNWPDPAQLNVGNINYFNRSKNFWISRMGKDIGLTNTGTDTGGSREKAVFPVWFTKDFGLKAGAELRFKYLDTQVNSLVRLSGSNGAALTMFALVNWIATPSKNRYALISGAQA